MHRKLRGLASVALRVIVSGFSLGAIAQPAPKRIEITASQFSFSPGEVTLKKGQPVLLILKSQDVAHGLRVRELGVAVKVNEHGTAQVQYTPQKASNFVGHCNVFYGKGHGSMGFTVHVAD